MTFTSPKQYRRFEAGGDRRLAEQQNKPAELVRWPPAKRTMRRWKQFCLKVGGLHLPHLGGHVTNYSSQSYRCKTFSVSTLEFARLTTAWMLSSLDASFSGYHCLALPNLTCQHKTEKNDQVEVLGQLRQLLLLGHVFVSIVF
jgi:hypothetical protein